MDGFYGDSGAGSGPWKIFRNSPVGISLAPLEGFPKGPSVMLKGTQPFDAGIYQQVAVKPGAGYTFTLGWAVERIDAQGWQDGFEINRRLGFDPFGGTDANSPNVQWTDDYFGSGKFALGMDAYAKSSTVTVFVRVQSPYQGKTVEVYLDAASMGENTGMPPIAVTVPTPTRIPATAELPTARPTRAPTAIAVIETPTEIVPTDTPEPSATVQPSPRLKPSLTPTRFATRIRRVTPTPTPLPGGADSMQMMALGVGGIAALGGIMGAGLLFLLALKSYRRSKS